MSDDFEDFFALQDSEEQNRQPQSAQPQIGDYDPDGGFTGENDAVSYSDLPLNDGEIAMGRREMRQLRRKRRRRWITTIISIIVVIALAVWGYFGISNLAHNHNSHASHDEVSLEYPGPGSGSVEFVITSGEGVQAIAAKLEQEDIVKSADAFESAVESNNSTLYPGAFALKKKMSSSQVIEILSDQSKAGGILQIKAGERVSEVLSNAAKASGLDSAQFKQLQQAKGSGILPPEAKGSFEGWLEPGSYVVSGKKSAAEVLKPAVDARVSMLNAVKAPTGEQRENLLIMASIAESEVNSPQYYPKVVRVILNRLAANMPLGMDTTVAYGLGTTANKLTDSMLADSSNPYNTRVNQGLTPTPISNPGDEAIRAAISPAEGNWMYFVTTNLKTGETKFTDSDQEFMRLRDEYKSTNSNAN